MYSNEKKEQQHGFLRAGSGGTRREDLTEMRRLKAQDEKEKVAEITIKKPPVPNTSFLKPAPVKPREKRNFISKNSKAAMLSSRPPRVEKEVSDKHEEFGRVPQYIQERKRKKEEEEEERRKKEELLKECPPGMIIMPEEERLETLRILQESKEIIEKNLRSLPIVCDTIGLKKKKTELENKLQEVDDAIGIFSRSKVYIAE
jgi:hypothetical protein